MSHLDMVFHEFWRCEERTRSFQLLDPSQECPFYCIRHELNVLLIQLIAAGAQGVDMLGLLTESRVLVIFLSDFSAKGINSEERKQV